MRPKIPPDLLSVVDTAGLDQQIDIALEIGVRVEMIRDIRTWELLEDFSTIRFESGVVAHPERRGGREREHVREKISCRVHDVNRAFTIRHADVHV